MKDFTHARLMCNQRNEICHVSLLHDHVSAYETNPGTIAWLEESILATYLRLRQEGSGSEMIDQDGEMQLQVCSGGQVRLMLPWKQFDLEVETGSGTKLLREMSTEDIGAYLASVTAKVEKAGRP